MARRPGAGPYRRDVFLWSTVGGALQWLNVLLGVVAVVLTLAVASKPFGQSFDYSVLSFFAAAATAALAFVKAEHRGRAWSKAGRHLENAIAGYDSDPQTVRLEELAPAREEAVAMTGEI
jgi:hypothetical protein